MNLMFFETSAKQGHNIKSLFNDLAKKLTGIETDPIANSKEDNKPKGFTISGGSNAESDKLASGTTKPPKPKRKGCC
jgi:hypothetical protein